jgi:hypothetical protein
MEQQYAVLDFASGRLQDVTALIPPWWTGMFPWCAEGTSFIAQYGGQVFRMDLLTMTAQPLRQFMEVAFCR